MLIWRCPAKDGATLLVTAGACNEGERRVSVGTECVGAVMDRMRREETAALGSCGFEASGSLLQAERP